MTDEQKHYYGQGISDYNRGITKCPYSTTSPRGECWSMGWFAAQEVDTDTQTTVHDAEVEDPHE